MDEQEMIEKYHIQIMDENIYMWMKMWKNEKWK
jgi:hypothetical protein